MIFAIKKESRRFLWLFFVFYGTMYNKIGFEIVGVTQKENLGNRLGVLFAIFPSSYFLQTPCPLAVLCRSLSPAFLGSVYSHFGRHRLRKRYLIVFSALTLRTPCGKGVRSLATLQRARERRRLVQVGQGEPKERNPKLLPIGDGFGFLLFFGDLQ